VKKNIIEIDLSANKSNLQLIAVLQYCFEIEKEIIIDFKVLTFELEIVKL